MTDKPIIINGVDVSGCEHLGLYKEYKLKCGGCYPVNYSDNPNCYYKQLIRKEQECQQAMDNYVQLDLQRVKEYNELVDLYKVKEQEYEELKKKKEENTTFYLKKYANKDSECLELQHNINVLKQTLTEIKEIVLGVRNYLNYPSPRDVRYEMDIILQKISECEV